MKEGKGNPRTENGGLRFSKQIDIELNIEELGIEELQLTKNEKAIRPRKVIKGTSKTKDPLENQVGLSCGRVKSGNFGHQVNLDSDIVCFIF